MISNRNLHYFQQLNLAPQILCQLLCLCKMFITGIQSMSLSIGDAFWPDEFWLPVVSGPSGPTELPEPPSPAAVRGTLVHTVLEEMFGRPGPERTPRRTAEA